MAGKDVKKATFERRPKSIRASVSFSTEKYEDISRIAQRKNVSIAWVVRDAIDQYLAKQTPLFESS